MKYKKIALILFSFLLTTGCDITYEVQFKKDKVVEKNTFYLLNNEVLDGDIVGTLTQLSIPYTDNTDFLIAPKTKITKDKNKTGYTTINEYEYNDYKTIGTCYEAFNVIKDENKVVISTSEQFQCFDRYKELDQLKVVAKVNYKVSNTNADKKKGNTYIWYIDKDNASNKPIQLSFDLSQKVSDWPFTNLPTYAIVIALLIVIVGTVVWIVSRISKRSNKI